MRANARFAAACGDADGSVENGRESYASNQHAESPDKNFTLQPGQDQQRNAETLVAERPQRRPSGGPSRKPRGREPYGIR